MKKSILSSFAFRHCGNRQPAQLLMDYSTPECVSPSPGGEGRGEGGRLTDTSSPQLRTGFTLIEMLVVIAIIGILAALIVGGAGYAVGKGRVSRVQAERDALITAIQSYKKTKGFYPLDNTNNPAQSSLFYELTGTAPGTVSGQPGFISPLTHDALTTNSVTAIFYIGGFVNSSPDPNEVYNFAPAVAKSSGTASFNYTNAGDSTSGTFTLFGVPVSGPSMTNSASGKAINLWNYSSSNPVHNPGSYDLWMDVIYSGKTNRISNWSPEPEVLH